MSVLNRAKVGARARTTAGAALDSPHYVSAAERQADFVVHLAGLGLALLGGGVLIGLSIGLGSADQLWSVGIYATGLVAMLALSTAYNFSPAHRQPVLRRLDHAGIFIMIAGSYTPFTTQHLAGGWAWAMTAGVWAIAIVGAAAKLLLPGLAKRFWVAIYLLLGWLMMVAIRPLFHSVGLAPLVLLLVGGALYTLGVGFYANKAMPFRRAVWHAHVVAAAGVHWSAVLLAVIRR